VAGRADLRFESRPRVKQRVVAKHSLDTLLDHACHNFAALTGLQPPGPFLPLGGVKMRLHRVVYVWACAMTEAPAPAAPAGAHREQATGISAGATESEAALVRPVRMAYGDAEFLPLAEARALIEPQERRFLDQLEGLLARPTS
jgi:hypothetical protein